MALAFTFKHSIAMAHEGHIDELMHAALHMVQDNGVMLGLFFLLIIASLIFNKSRFRSAKQSTFQSKKIKTTKKVENDSR